MATSNFARDRGLREVERSINEEEKADHAKHAELAADPALHPTMTMAPGGSFDMERPDNHAKAMVALQEHEKGMAERDKQRQEVREKYGFVAPGAAKVVPPDQPKPTVPTVPTDAGAAASASAPAPAPAEAGNAPPDAVQRGGNEAQTRQLAQDAHEQKMLTTLSQQAEPQKQAEPAADAAKAKREPIPRPTREDGKKHGHELV